MDSAHLPEIAKEIRCNILKMVYNTGEGHLAGCLSSTEILTALYFGGIMDKNDKFVLSCGHYSPLFYSVLSKKGLIPETELLTFKDIGSRLQGHPHKAPEIGIETSSGPLGQGLSQAAGMALGVRDRVRDRVFCLMSDGEQQEGQVWEAAMFAPKYKLNNLLAIVDKNNIQIDGKVKEIMPLGDLGGRYQSSGWEVFEIDGHNFGQILDVFESAKLVKGKPVVIIARTVAGKGVSFMEGKWEWHHGSLSSEMYKKAISELENSKHEIRNPKQIQKV